MLQVLSAQGLTVWLLDLRQQQRCCPAGVQHASRAHVDLYKTPAMLMVSMLQRQMAGAGAGVGPRAGAGFGHRAGAGDRAGAGGTGVNAPAGVQGDMVRQQEPIAENPHLQLMQDSLTGRSAPISTAPVAA